MKFNEYQQLANRTAPTDLEFNLTLSNLCMGLAGETGEIVDLLKKFVFHGHDLDSEKLVSEFGDLLWYLSQLSLLFGEDLEYIAESNIKKLKKRYPEGFSEERSINRVE